MEVHGYTENGSINATIEGQRWSVPDVPGNRFRQMIAEWEAEGNVIPKFIETIENIRTQKLNDLANKRYQVETSGIKYNNIPIATDRSTVATLTAAYIDSIRNQFYTINWKIENGYFVTLTAKDIIEIHTLIQTHIQQAFNTEKEISIQILAITKLDELKALNIEEVWG